jgi:hypothetical protein
MGRGFSKGFINTSRYPSISTPGYGFFSRPGLLEKREDCIGNEVGEDEEEADEEEEIEMEYGMERLSMLSVNISTQSSSFH